MKTNKKKTAIASGMLSALALSIIPTPAAIADETQLPPRIAGADRYATSKAISGVSGLEAIHSDATTVVDGVLHSTYASAKGKSLVLLPPSTNTTKAKIFPYGPSRIDTAENIAKESGTGRSVFVVGAYSDVDQMVGASAAAIADGSIILSSTPQRTAETVSDLEPSRVYIVGGTGVVPQDVENAVKQKVENTVRVGGADRYGTAVNLANAVAPGTSRVFVANGDNPVDSISLAPLAGKTGIPVVYVKNNCVTDVTKNYLDTTAIRIIIGGEGAVSSGATSMKCSDLPKPEPKLPPAPPAPVQPVNPYGAGTNKGIAYDMLGQFGFGPEQMPALDNLWTRESGWNHNAYNRRSGATGIPQALPGSKMASAGPDWRTNPATQIRWGLGYIKARYGSPQGAWGHFLRRGWY